MVCPFPLQNNMQQRHNFIWFLLNTINQESSACKGPCQLEEFKHLKELCEMFYVRGADVEECQFEESHIRQNLCCFDTIERLYYSSGYISWCCHYGTKRATKLTTVIKEYAIGSNCTINSKKLFQKREKELKIKKYYSLVAVLSAFFFIFSFNFMVYHSETVQSIFKITILLRFVKKFVLFLKTVLISALL